METRKITSIGTAAGNRTTLGQPLPDGPVITIPAGPTSVPVTSVTGTLAGERIGIGKGATSCLMRFGRNINRVAGFRGESARMVYIKKMVAAFQ